MFGDINIVIIIELSNSLAFFITLFEYLRNLNSNNIKQRLSLREPLAQALDVMAKLVEQLDFKNRPSDGEAYAVSIQNWRLDKILP